MVGLQFQYMSIRRSRNRQQIKLVNDQQERAKQKLFQISYFDDEPHFNGSQMLNTNASWQRQTASQRKEMKLKAIKEMPLKKNSEISVHKSDDTVSIQNLSARRGIKTIQLDRFEESPTIFNTLESNRVFVGHKKVLVNTAKAFLSEKLGLSSNKKRIETMPVIKQKSYLKLPQEEYPQSNRQIMTETPKQREVADRWRLAGLLAHKNPEQQSYIKLKNKLKRDLFNTIEQRMALSNRIIYF